MSKLTQTKGNIHLYKTTIRKPDKTFRKTKFKKRVIANKILVNIINTHIKPMIRYNGI